MRAVLVLNGPHLGRLGRRQPEIYGRTTHAELVELCRAWGADLGLDVEVRQTNHEGQLLDWLNAAADDHTPVVLNAAAWTHYSYALFDACAQLTAPLVEVHLSDPAQRPEVFRHHSVVSEHALEVIAGRGVDGYRLALEVLAVAEHYAATGLLAAIESGLARAGLSPETVTVDDLGPVEEFHVGGRPATERLLSPLGFEPGRRLLDVGAGLGGTARFVAARFGAHVTGVDLTEEFVTAGRVLSEWIGLADLVDLHHASALSMPFEEDSFDGAYQLHVGMNIEDKAALFAEVARVLRPGAPFAVYDVMRVGPGEVAYPVPWASTASTSFLAGPDDYVDALTAAGFTIADPVDRREAGLEFFAAMRARAAQAGGPPPLGLHLVMGEDAATKLADLVDALERGVLAPVELVAHAG